MNTEQIFSYKIQIKLFDVLHDFYREYNIKIPTDYNPNSFTSKSCDKIMEIFNSLQLKEKCLHLALEHYRHNAITPSLEINEAIIDLAKKLEEQLLPKTEKD